MYDWNGSIRSLNVGLPDDIARLKAAGYYQEAIARIDRLLAEDWTKTQNGPASNGIAPPEGYVPPENPTPHGVDALREALTVPEGDHAPAARGILLDGSRGHRPDAGAGQGLHGRGI